MRRSAMWLLNCVQCAMPSAGQSILLCVKEFWCCCWCHLARPTPKAIVYQIPFGIGCINSVYTWPFVKGVLYLYYAISELKLLAVMSLSIALCPRLWLKCVKVLLHAHRAREQLSKLSISPKPNRTSIRLVVVVLCALANGISICPVAIMHLHSVTFNCI